MQSVICNFFIKTIKKLYFFFSHSFLAKILTLISSFFVSSVDNSAFVRFLKKDHVSNEFFKESVILKLLLKCIHSLVCIGKKFKSRYELYRSKSAILFFADNWNLFSIRIYGISMFSFGIVYGILRLFTNSLTLKAFIFCIFLIFAGICFILINKSLKSLFKGSSLLKIIGGIFYGNASKIHNRLFLEDDIIHIKGNIVSGVIGAILACLMMIFSPVWFTLSFFGIILVLFCIKILHMGVFITIVLSLVISSKALSYLLVLCTFSFGAYLMKRKSRKTLYCTTNDRLY